MHNRKKLFCCNVHVCYQKIINLVQKNVKKVMTSNAWHCFCTYCMKEHRYLLHFSIINVTQRLVGTYSVGKTKSIRLRLELQGCKTKTKTEAGLRPVLS